MTESAEKLGRACIARVLNGDREAFRELIGLYDRLVFCIAAKLIDRQDEREDISQEVFIRVYENMNSFRGECSLSTWIAKITYNLCINRLRKKKELYIENRDPSSWTNGNDDSDALPDEALENKELKERLLQEIEGLPESMRVSLTLFHMQGFRYDEIARVMNQPEGTVKSHLFRARQLLKKRLLEKYKKEEWIQ